MKPLAATRNRVCTCKLHSATRAGAYFSAARRFVGVGWLWFALSVVPACDFLFHF